MNMKYLEDEFDLEEYKRSFSKRQIVPVKHKNVFVSFALTLVELALAFTVAYFLFRGGQYLLDLFLN